MVASDLFSDSRGRGGGGAERGDAARGGFVVGGAPFFSDVRAFNTSYTDEPGRDGDISLLHPEPCTAGTPTVDVHAGAAGVAGVRRHGRDDVRRARIRRRRRVRASRDAGAARGDEPAFLDRSRADRRDVHPGLHDSEAHSDDGPDVGPQRRGGPGFRTNVGVFNRRASAVDVTFTVFDGRRIRSATR